jgi:hypothetical protein
MHIFCQGTSNINQLYRTVRQIFPGFSKSNKIQCSPLKPKKERSQSYSKNESHLVCNILVVISNLICNTY